MALSEGQKSITQSDKRFRVAICGRRWGKTYLSIREIAKFARIPNKKVFYVAPSYRMAKQIVWDKLKYKLMDMHWVEKVNESDLSIQLINGSKIYLRGADNYDSLRGVGLDFLVMDEFAMIDEKAWSEVLRPTLSDTGGSALFISTPMGQGNWAYNLFRKQESDPENWVSWQFTSLSGGRIPAEEIEQAKRDLDARTFKQEYEASFETYAGRIYYAFDRKENVIDGALEPRDLDVLYVGMDFNIDPMSAVIAIRRGDTLCVIDEIRMYSSNTQETVEELRSRYPKSKIWVYPDPAARQRKTSAGGSTDLTILQNAGFVVKAPTAHTPVRDRINAVNSRLLGADGVRRLFITPKCKYTIEGLERHTYKEGTTQPDKDSGYDHMMDALGYMVDYLFPVRRDQDPGAMMPQRLSHRLA
jgi:hypothetical protein